MKPAAVWFAALLLLLPLGSTSSALASHTITGRWVGTWVNSNGKSGPDSLEVMEYPSGQIVGVWGDGYHILGRRVGPDTYYWESRTEGKLYRATAHLVDEGHAMLVDYSVEYASDGELRTYWGESQMHRLGGYR